MQSAKRGLAQNKSIARIFIISIKQFLFVKKIYSKSEETLFLFLQARKHAYDNRREFMCSQMGAKYGLGTISKRANSSE